MTIIRLTLTVLFFGSVAVASGVYEPIDTTNFANRSDDYQGRLVMVTGVVCAVNADGKSIQIFESETKALIEVTLTQLRKSQRRSLMLNPVRRVSVYGRTQVRNGKLSIDAHKVVPQVHESVSVSDSQANEGK